MQCDPTIAAPRPRELTCTPCTWQNTSVTLGSFGSFWEQAVNVEANRGAALPASVANAMGWEVSAALPGSMGSQKKTALP